ncbi:MAG TPA: TCR/Tet family MFS transporter [Edaphobacter sp.]|nr:TCR/Tet family MFS transporter [Edaphobacter sp.]
MSDRLENTQPANTEPNPLLTEPEFVVPPPGEDNLPPPAPGRRAAATFIFLTVSLDMLALGMIAPVLPRLIESFLHGDTSSASRMLGLFGTVFAVVQFFCSPILGSLSDRIGRRPIVLLSNFGLGLDYLLMAWAPALHWLFLGRVISGITSSSIPTAMAYMADITPHERRAAAFGMLSGAFGLGLILGPSVGGILGSIHPRLPFWVAAGLSLLNGLYGLFVLPESLRREHRMDFSWRRANPIGSLDMLRRGGMLALSGMLLFGYIAQQSLMNVFVIYGDYRYRWSDRTVGLALATLGAGSALYGAVLLKPVVARLRERKAIALGLIGGTVGYSLFGLARTGWLFWLGMPLLNLMSFAWPSAQGLLSRKTTPSEQGQLQAAINSLRGIAGVIGPGIFTWIFSKSIGPHAVIPFMGSPFFVAASMLLIGLVFLRFSPE